MTMINEKGEEQKEILLSIINTVNSNISDGEKKNLISCMISREKLKNLEMHSLVIFDLYNQRKDEVNPSNYKKFIRKTNLKPQQVTLIELLVLYCGAKVFPLLSMDMFEEKHVLLYLCESVANNDKVAISCFLSSDYTVGSLNYQKELIHEKKKNLPKSRLNSMLFYDDLNNDIPSGKGYFIECYIKYLKENGATIKNCFTSQKLSEFIKNRRPDIDMFGVFISSLKEMINKKELTIFKELLSVVNINKHCIIKKTLLIHTFRHIEKNYSSLEIKKLTPFIKTINEIDSNDKYELNNNVFAKDTHLYCYTEKSPTPLLYIPNLLHKIKIKDFIKLMCFEGKNKLNICFDIQNIYSVLNVIDIYKRFKAKKQLLSLCISPSYNNMGHMKNNGFARGNNIYALAFCNDKITAKHKNELYDILRENNIHFSDMTIENLKLLKSHISSENIFWRMIDDDCISFDLYQNKMRPEKDLYNLSYFYDLFEFSDKKQEKQKVRLIQLIGKNVENMVFFEDAILGNIFRGNSINEVRRLKKFCEHHSNRIIILPEDILFNKYLDYLIYMNNEKAENEVMNFFVENITSQKQDAYWSDKFIVKQLHEIEKKYDTNYIDFFRNMRIIYEQKILSALCIVSEKNNRIRL